MQCPKKKFFVFVSNTKIAPLVLLRSPDAIQYEIENGFIVSKRELHVEFCGRTSQLRMKRTRVGFRYRQICDVSVVNCLQKQKTIASALGNLPKEPRIKVERNVVRTFDDLSFIAL